MAFMAFKRYTVGATSVTADGKETTWSDVLVSAVKSPINAFGSDGESNLITEKEAGQRSLIAYPLLFIGGEAYGQYRAKRGQGALYRLGRS